MKRKYELLCLTPEIETNCEIGADSIVEKHMN